MVPGAGDKIVQVLIVRLLERGIDARRPDKVLLVVPSCNVKVRYGGVLENARDRMPIPKIMVRMLDKVTPGGKLSMEMILVRV